MARPTIFTDELFDAICADISQSDKGLVHICKKHNLNAKTFYDWIAKDTELSNKYTRAREMQADFMADQIVAIADDSTNDTILTDKGELPNTEWINRSRLRVDARKWLAAKLKPRVYGDKVDLTTQGEKLTTPCIINWGQAAEDKNDADISTHPKTD